MNLAGPISTAKGKTVVGILWSNGWPLFLAVLIAVTLLFNLDRGGIFDVSSWPSATPQSASPTLANPLDAQPSAKVPDLNQTPNLNPRAIHCILHFTTWLLILINTAIVFNELFSAAKTIGENRKLDWSARLTFWSIILTAIWMFKLVSFHNSKYLDEILIDEIVALGMFGIFAIIDLLSWSVYSSISKTRTPRRELIIEARFSRSQMFLVDVPVIVGIVISLIMASLLKMRFRQSEDYLVVFFSGATVMHLAASQMIFYILAVWRDFLKYRHA